MSSEWPAGVGRILLAETDSTNAEALRRAGVTAAPTWIMAGHQTAARGRRGRTWAMPPGNFGASLLLRPRDSAEASALLSFVAALALHDALREMAGDGRLELKWPNDVLLNGGKVAGILLESVGSGRGLDHLAIGFGVNLAAAPDPGALEPGALHPVSVQGETGIDVGPESFLCDLAAAFAAREATFATVGFAPIRASWLAQAARLGEPIVARTGTTERRGRFETVDESGALVLHASDGRHAIPAADIYF